MLHLHFPPSHPSRHTRPCPVSLSYDPVAAADFLMAADDRLARVIERVGPLRLELRPMPHPFHGLLRAIVYQQLSGKAAATIYGRVEALFETGPTAGPTPEALLALPDEALRGAGLSRAKTAAAKDLAAKTLTGTVPTRAELDTLPNAEIVERLTAVRGIGPWTVEMLLIFSLGRPDVLPATDLGVRKGVAEMDGLEVLPTPAEVLRRGASWSPYRSAAAWYLWRAADGVMVM